MTTTEYLLRQWRALSAKRAKRVNDLRRPDAMLERLRLAIEREQQRDLRPIQMTLH